MKLRNVLDIASASDPGLVRAFNEDSIAIDDDAGLIVLADGMGGYKAGDVASGMATMMITAELNQALNDAATGAPVDYAEAVKAAVAKANQAIYHAAHTKSQFQGMGTTLAMILFHDNRVVIGHVGDSRLYRLRHDKLEQMTVDHSILQEQVELGLISTDDARMSHNRNLVTRALGVEAEVAVAVREEDALPGDIYLLCSDGLNDMVDDADIELALNTLQENLPLLAQQLVMMANDNGGHDNVSVAAVRILKPFSGEPRGWFAKLFGWALKRG